MAEWLKATDCKSFEDFFYIGSNPIFFKSNNKLKIQTDMLKRVKEILKTKFKDILATIVVLILTLIFLEDQGHLDFIINWWWSKK